MKNGLNNPALVATEVANTPEGKKAVSNILETADKTVKATSSIVKGVVGIMVFGTVGYIGYTMLFNGFVSISEDTAYSPSNITTGVAKAKAASIFQAMYGPGDNFNSVKMNIKDINHNGMIRVYNQFGKKRGIVPLSKKLNMFEWFEDQFTNSELAELRFLQPNFF